jgi:hypothetical protein
VVEVGVDFYLPADLTDDIGVDNLFFWEDFDGDDVFGGSFPCEVHMSESLLSENYFPLPSGRPI